jgi:hypothetical protein
MKYLANILTEENFDDTTYYNVVSDSKNLIPGLPTLIIGRERAKELYPEAPILNWKINDDTYWTYGKRVRRERNEDDIKRFKELVLKRAIKKIDYFFFNVLTATKEEKRNLNIYLFDSRQKYSMVSNGMLYVYFPETSEVMGLSLNDIEYSGMDSAKLLRMVAKCPFIKRVEERDFVSYETRDIIKNKRYMIPYLSSLNA